MEVMFNCNVLKNHMTIERRTGKISSNSFTWTENNIKKKP